MTNTKTALRCSNCCEPFSACKCGPNRETWDKGSFICPYCGLAHDPSETDGVAYDESTDSYQCDNCGEDFILSVYISYSWTARQKGR